ncbi:hypothetical protein TcWFU_009842 [Taenia crassiceps]|uniref:Uncharacterized protein n=1 Tax=Taenia crassiceps TaxID=6207 RepID=A0ABR4QJ44_9CEST
MGQLIPILTPTPILSRVGGGGEEAAPPISRTHVLTLTYSHSFPTFPSPTPTPTSPRPRPCPRPPLPPPSPPLLCSPLLAPPLVPSRALAFLPSTQRPDEAFRCAFRASQCNDHFAVDRVTTITKTASAPTHAAVAETCHQMATEQSEGRNAGGVGETWVRRLGQIVP